MIFTVLKTKPYHVFTITIHSQETDQSEEEDQGAFIFFMGSAISFIIVWFMMYSAPLQPFADLVNRGASRW